MIKRSFKILFLVLYLPLGVFLLFSLTAPYFNPAQWPFFAATGLFFPVLWLLNVMYLFLFRLLRSKAWIFSLLLLLGGLYQAFFVFQLNGQEKENTPGKAVTLISFNTGNADTLDPFESRRRVFEQKAFRQADVICLQEFLPGHEKGQPVLEHFENVINVDFTGKMGSRSSGLSVYSNYPILEQGFLKAEGEDTYALWASLDLGTDTLMLINVQMQSIRLEDEEVEVLAHPWQLVELLERAGNIYRKLTRGFVWREQQVEELKDLIGNSRHAVILCGDLNDPPASYAYNQLRTDLQDAFMEKGRGFGFTYAGPLPFLRIDYVMTGEEVWVRSFDKIKETFSDHYALEVELIIHR
ncbi:MAG: endonuclease/exonuclease/phosphatase family protein [Bacteroidota bacterium]|nr:endonuclease/exonuclease/phosphatase family protein [Bacteroidota bacterium]